MNAKIAVLAGDGIGSEITDQAVKVLNAIAEKFNHSFLFEKGLTGAIAIDEVGDPYPQETHELCMRSDAVLFGAVGHPKYDNDPKAKLRPEQGLLAMRKKLELFANIRPVKTFPSLIRKSPLKEEIVKNVDFVVIRELTGGIYFGEPRGRNEAGTKAFDTNVYSRDEILRVTELAFEYARKRNKKLTAVDKANVLATSRLWRETIQEMSADYNDVETDYMFVDNAAMQIIQNPGQFDVMVTGNMFGDILTDEASVITGSLGMLPSASYGIHTSVFEPIHGSFPQGAGKNIANPCATILSASMLLESLNLIEEADSIKKSVNASLESNFVTADLDRSVAKSTSEVGDRIAEYILKN